ncbi:MAG: response regulator [Dehalococcoidia bacterium]
MPYVLVVDDDPDIRRLLEEVLTDEGYETRLASNGAEALTAVAEREPDLILLDLMMPVMDGRQFCERFLRSRDAGGRRAPVLVISADRALPEQARRMGVDGYIAKPFDIDHPLDVVARRLG